MTDDQTPAEAGWDDAALDRLRDALKAMPASKNEQPKTWKGGDDRG